MNLKSISLITILLSVIIILSMCEDDKITTDPSHKLLFAVDTVRFDTVFTTIGSATRRLMVYNPNKRTIRTDIRLSENSPFRINIDGSPAHYANGIEIAAKDSMYIFIQVNIDPQGDELPVIVNDSILFETNSNRQQVLLEAYGQDVFILRNETIQSQTWDAPKPYLIYGQLVVDTLQTLQIKAGARIYLHRDADIYVKGSLVAEGTTDKRITFSGDRLENLYERLPGQWGSIILGQGSNGNRLVNVDIRNGTNGLLAGEPGGQANPGIYLDHVIISDMAHSGIQAFGSDIQAYTCLVTNCAYYTAGLFCGGTYRFTHCTIANNYSSYIQRRAIPALVISNTYYGIAGTTVVDALFENTIVYGTMTNELDLDPATDYFFDHCLLRGTTGPESLFSGCIFNENPLFVSPQYDDFHISETSPAKDKGKYSIAQLSPWDLDGNSRLIDGKPDIGTYEWHPDE